MGNFQIGALGRLLADLPNLLPVLEGTYKEDWPASACA